jgi:NAD(P)-dependent dehydrogenase (short-subunit alcohol dehydrogenase family)
MSQPIFNFSDTVAIVTGATSGIGATIAHRFGGSGASVMLTGRNTDRGEAAVAEIFDAGGIAAFVSGDITDRNFAKQLIDATVHRFGAPDILVNSAGVIHHATAEATSDEQWRETMAVNVDGVFFVSRATIPAMREHGGGVIINIASDAGLSGSAHLVAYCASKGAVIQITRAMAIDHAADRIRLIAVCPGDVDTPMLRGELRERGIDPEPGLRESAAAVPLNRVCTPEEVADLVLYAASDSARFMTGTAIAIDGGSGA